MPNDSERLDALEAAESGPNNSDDQYDTWRDDQPETRAERFLVWAYQQEAIKEEDDG